MHVALLVALALGLASPVAAACLPTAPTCRDTFVVETRPPLHPTTRVYQWGVPGDVPVAGDFDADGLPDLVVFRPSTGTWFVRTSRSGFTAFVTYQWGLAGDVPLVQDYDGDGHVDLAIYRPSSGEWFIRYWSAQGY
jgi:hypothetical protein